MSVVRWQRHGGGGGGLRRAKGIELNPQTRVIGRQHRHGKQRRVGRPGTADGKGRDRHTFGHLDDAVERIDPLQMATGNRHAEHRHSGLGRQHAGQVRRAAGTCDDGDQAAWYGTFGVGEKLVRHAMRRDHAGLVCNTELLENLDRMAHRFPVGIGAHHHADFYAGLDTRWICIVHAFNFTFHSELHPMIDITLENFQTELVDGSLGIPVLLDIWAEWCGPCKQLGPVLEKLEADYAGRFRLAKLDAEAVPQISQQLSEMFNVRSIPFCVMFKDGQPVDGFVGAIPAAEIRTFLDKHVAPESDDALERKQQDDAAQQQAVADNTPEAIFERLQHAVATDPGDDDTRFDYVKLLLQRGQHDDAKVAFAPVISKTATVRRLDALQHWMNAIDFATPVVGAAPSIGTLDAQIAANKRDFQARFDRARLLMAGQQWTAAMDELLDILMRDKSWSDELARKTYVAILDIIEPHKPKVADGQIAPDDPVVATYRRRLSSVVLS